MVDEEYGDEIFKVYKLDSKLKALEPVIKSAKTVHYKKGEIILRAYGDTEYLYRIRKGLIKVYSISSSGQEKIIEIYGPGDIFPIGWIIGRGIQDVYFETMTDCELRIVSKEIVMEQLKKSADISFAILRKVMDQFMLYSSRVVNLELKFGRERLAYRLLLLAARIGEKQNDKLILPFISQQDLASAVNIGRESASREMARFERLGLIKYTRKNIIINDHKKLHNEIGKDVEILYYDTIEKKTDSKTNDTLN